MAEFHPDGQRNPRVFNQTAKEVVKYALTRMGLYDVLRKARGKDLGFKKLEKLEDRFSYTYDRGRWNKSNPDIPSSGSGSTLASTENLREALPKMLAQLGSQTLLDVGCGDFHWMRTVDLGGVNYIGVDLVPSVIEANSANFTNEKRKFLLANAVSGDLPEADTVLCREVLFHLSFQDARAVVQNILAKPRKWVMLTTDRLTTFNFDVASGDYRLLNLEAAPFNFPTPSHIIHDSNIAYRALGVWKPDELRKALAG